jgi:hypothetical protein
MSGRVQTWGRGAACAAVDLHDGEKWIELGSTRAWNWQQVCMLRWIPGNTR